MTTSQPTDFELELLKVLWDRGPSTAREALRAIEASRSVGYTTVLKMLQLMDKKGMVKVDRSNRSHVYEAALQRKRTMSSLLNRFLDRTFDGAAEELLVHLAEGELTSQALDQLELRIAALRAKEKRS